MKLFKAAFIQTALFSALVASAGLAGAAVSHVPTLVSNVPLDVSRYEIMDANTLIGMANQGNDHAQFYLAKRYQKGIGIAQDTQKAIEWYTRAGNQNVTPAQLNLGLMYVRGEGVPADGIKARYWLEKAAKRGDNRASYTLALLDEKQQRLVDAYKWYDLAARDGMLDENVRSRAQGKIGQLALNLSSADINSARQQADSWFQSK